jgi:hypothetical protein
MLFIEVFVGQQQALARAHARLIFASMSSSSSDDKLNTIQTGGRGLLGILRHDVLSTFRDRVCESLNEITMHL